MYIRITSKCNMSCIHCCYSCTEQGEDMSKEVFEKALELCQQYDDVPFLGGGEPTMHPHFNDFLLEAMAACSGESKVGIVTNGKIKKKGLLIATLTRAGVIYGELSQDQYHDPIDLEVVEAFRECGTHHYNKRKYMAIRDITHGGTLNPLPHGRALDLLDEEELEEISSKDAELNCVCPGWVIQPNGDIHQCGCEDSPKIGDVFNGVKNYNIPNYCCHYSEEFAEAMESHY